MRYFYQYSYDIYILNIRGIKYNCFNVEQKKNTKQTTYYNKKELQLFKKSSENINEMFNMDKYFWIEIGPILSRQTAWSSNIKSILKKIDNKTIKRV